MLLEENALVRHVLIDNPQAFGVHRDDEAAAHLAERLQVNDLVRAWQRSGCGCRSHVGNRGAERLPLRICKIAAVAGSKLQALRDGPVRRARKFKRLTDSAGGTQRSWNLGAWWTREHSPESC